MPTVRRHNVADHAARTAGSPRLRGPRTLRVRLVVTIVLVIAAVCAVVGVSTEIYLGDYLVRQLDSQLLQIHRLRQVPIAKVVPSARAALRRRAPAIRADPQRSDSRNPSVRWRPR